MHDARLPDYINKTSSILVVAGGFFGQTRH